MTVVGVMGSGVDEHRDRAEPLGRWLGEMGVHLLTGGGGGVMRAVSRAYCETAGRRGLCIGVLPASADGDGPPVGYPNEWVDLPIVTHLSLSGSRGVEPGSRNHINVLSSAVIIALPGGAGTSSEVRLALRYGRPVIAFLRSRNEIPDLPDTVQASGDFSVIQAFVRSVVERQGAARHAEFDRHTRPPVGGSDRGPRGGR